MSFRERSPHQRMLPPGDMANHYKNARNEWDDRIGDSVSMARKWRNVGLLSMGVALLSIMGNIHLADIRDHRPIVVVVRDRVGTVIAVANDRAESGAPTLLDISSSLKRWVYDTRTVYRDRNALRHNIQDAFNMTEAGSQANEMLMTMYKESDPVERAKLQTVEISQEVARPATNGPDPDGNQSWVLQWREIVASRADDSIISSKNYTATIIFKVTREAQTVEQAMSDPDAIHVNTVQWGPQS